MIRLKLMISLCSISFEFSGVDCHWKLLYLLDRRGDGDRDSSDVPDSTSQI